MVVGSLGKWDHGERGKVVVMSFFLGSEIRRSTDPRVGNEVGILS